MARPSAVLSYALVCFYLGTNFGLRAQGPEPAAVVSAPATANIERVDVIPRPDGLTIHIAVNAAVTPEASRVSNPERLIFDFPGCDLKGGNRHIPVNRGAVKELRLSLFSIHPPVARVVVQLKAALEFELKQAGNEVVVDIPFPKEEQMTSVPVVRAPEARAPEVHAAVAEKPLAKPIQRAQAKATLPPQAKPIRSPELTL
jgi:hypothetical protein